MVYLLHFDRKMEHAQHYIGFTDTPLKRRLREHKGTKGSKIMQAFIKSGRTYVVAQVWRTGDRTFERELKNRKKARKFCPVCRKQRGFKPTRLIPEPK